MIAGDEEGNTFVGRMMASKKNVVRQSHVLDINNCVLSIVNYMNSKLTPTDCVYVLKTDEQTAQQAAMQGMTDEDLSIVITTSEDGVNGGRVYILRCPNQVLIEMPKHLLACDLHCLVACVLVDLHCLVA